MKKIITITLNPAFDIHCTIENFVPFKENYANNKLRSIGGKGINVSRGLNCLGVENQAVCILGNQNGDSFLKEAKAEGINILPTYVNGEIRENFTLHSSSQTETRISFDGFECSNNILDDILKEIKPDIDTIVAFCGRLPKGISKQAAISFLKAIKEKGSFLAVDSNSFNINDLISIKPDLIKPNESEAKLFFGDTDNTEFAKQLNKKGIKYVLISLGDKGGIFSSEDQVFKISVPKIKSVSTIGAGDSTIAGFIYGIYYGANIKETVKSAFALGTAACLVEGTAMPLMKHFKSILSDIKLNKV